MKKLALLSIVVLLTIVRLAYANTPSTWEFYQSEADGSLHLYLSDDPDQHVVFENVSAESCNEKGYVLQWQLQYDNTSDDLVPYMLDTLQGSSVPEFMPSDVAEFLQNYTHLHAPVTYCTYLPVVIN